MTRSLLALLAALALASPALAQSTGGGGGSGGGSGTVTSVACPSATITTTGNCNPLAVAGTSGDVITAAGSNGIQDGGAAPTTKSGSFVDGDCIKASGTAGAVADAGSACGSSTGAAIHGTPTATHCTSWFDSTTVQDAGAACGSAGAGASYQAQPGNPTAPGSTTTFFMQGLAGSITPATSGKVLIIISGVCNNNSDTTGGNGIRLQLSYGTGAHPNNGDALTGTQVGAIEICRAGNTSLSSSYENPFSTQAVVTGLATSTAVWLDLAADSISGTGWSLINVNISAVEIP